MPPLPFAAVQDRIDRVTQSALSDALLTWYPSSGEAARTDIPVLFRTQPAEAFEKKTMPSIEYLTADLPGLRRSETVSIARGEQAADYVIGNIDPLSPGRAIAWLNSRAGACQ